MTIDAAVSTQWDALMVADSRLIASDRFGRSMAVRDVCQKLAAANGWSVVGWAGDLCLARSLWGIVINRLRETNPADPRWLQRDDSLHRVLEFAVHEHASLGPEHKACQNQVVELLILWVNHTKSIVVGIPDTFVPGTEVIILRTPSMTISHANFGIEVIGSGSIITPDLNAARIIIFNMARGYEFGEAMRCLGTAMLIRQLLEARRETTVGGLYQLAHVSYRGVETVPYFYWVSVEPGYGTYVAMRIENGMWVQEHRPTGTRVDVLNPLDIPHRGRTWDRGNHQMFDPAKTLTRRSPGVIPEHRPLHLVTGIYDPADVPEPIRASWGDEPLAPLTFREPRRRTPIRTRRRPV